MEAVIDYNGELEDLSADPEMPPGLGKVTVYGGKFEVENKTRELRDVFRSVLLPFLMFLICKRQTPFLVVDMTALAVFGGQIKSQSIGSLFKADFQT